MLRSVFNKTQVLRWLPTVIVSAIAAKAFQVALSTYRQELTTGVEPWKLADWLINYEGGFVRRGLVGQISYFLTSSALAQQNMILVIQVVAYVVILATTIFLFHKSPKNWPWVALVLSPTFLLFPYVQNAATFRKEILGIAVVGLVAVASQVRWTHIVQFAGIFLYLFALLSSEVNVAFLPVLLWLIIRQRSQSQTRQWLSALQVGLLLVFTFCATALTIIYSGNETTANQICNSIVDRGFNKENCTGAISTLASDLSSEMASVALQFPGYTGYLALALLALFPLLMTGFLKSHWRLSLLAFFVLLPLFIAGLDYGRWIMISVVGLSYAALSVSQQLEPPNRRLPWPVYVIFLVSWSPTFYGPPWRQESVVGRLLDFFQ